MKKSKSLFTCQECGSVHNKWAGKCLECGAWNSIIEEKPPVTESFSSISNVNSAKLEVLDIIGEVEDVARTDTSISELNRVLGGGLVKGGAILLGGDPGIGKSTLLMQLAATLADNGKRVVYISGEESVGQIRLRAARLGVAKEGISLICATNVNSILATLKEIRAVDLVIIDSIQTIYLSEISSAPGTVSQVRAAANELISYSKANDIGLILVGHVTKEGQIAGPKLLEHMVDTVLYFEGEKGNQFRILRAVKNRFGGVNEIGVFEMADKGLREITNPSSLFLTEYGRAVSGTSVFAGMEGTRPILVEIQALVAPTFMATPRRAVVGWDINRLSVIIAVLNMRYGTKLGDKEVYLNVAGGIKINDPAADLAVAASLLSAVSGAVLPAKSVIFGEVGLSGEVRSVAGMEVRLKEAAKLGFELAIVPPKVKLDEDIIGLRHIHHVKEIKELLACNA